MEPAVTPTTPAAGRWFPRPVETAAAATGSVAALLLAAVTDDPPGRVIFGVAAAGLLLLVAADLLLRPRLAADATGVQVRTLAVRRRLPWSALRVDVDERSRYGLVSRALELEAGDTLVVLGRRALGDDPRDVADALARIRYTA